MSHYSEEKCASSEDDLSQQPFLPDELHHVPLRRSKPSKLQWTGHILSFARKTLILLASAIIIVTTFRPLNNVNRAGSSVNPELVLECGTSADEARIRGCVFDVMHYSWIPAPCYNDTLSQSYWEGLTDLGIEFWNDTTKQHILPYKEILAAKHEFVYTSWLLHLKHCQYLLHRQIQTLVYGLPLDNLLRNESHAEHCLEEVRHPSDVRTMLYSGTAYLKCASGVGDIGSIYWRQPLDEET